MLLTNVSLTNNAGGGLDNSGTATLIDVTLSGNTFKGGGGAISNTAALTLINSTVADNSATGPGGGILNNKGTVSLSNVTLSGNAGVNSGGGICNLPRGVVTIANTIVAANTVTGRSVGPDAAGVFASSGSNLIGQSDGSSGWIAADRTGTTAKPLNARLTRLGNNGGLTQTLLPGRGSPAIAHGSGALLPSGIVTDQRGAVRVVSGGVDIGAVESEAIVVNTTDDLLDGTIRALHMTLRDAVSLANQASTPSAINFDPSVFAKPLTITLIGGSLTFSNTSDPISLIGPLAGITLGGNHHGGGLVVDAGVAATISGVSITDSSTRGISNHGHLSLTDVTISGNLAGGLTNQPGATATLVNVTVSGNSLDGYGGGGIHNYGALTLINSTLAGNTTTGYGGGILNDGGTLSLAECTIADNTSTNPGGGLRNSFAGTVTLSNTLIAANISKNSVGADVSGTFKSGGFNLIGKADGSAGWIGGDLTGTNARPINPLLSPLADHGGRTFTIQPLAFSPAIAAGSPALIPSGISTDQRGVTRAIAGGVDIGAFETQVHFTSSISGSLFNDLNGNGSPDNGEPGLARWVVFLDLNKNGIDDPGEPTTTTDSQGNYQFRKLAPGSYRVVEVQPNGAGFTLTPSTGYVDVTVTASQAISGLDFGERKIANAAISGKVYNDVNGNKVFDSTDSLLAGWTVYLDLNNDGALNNNEPSTLTDARGNYTFKGITPGTYMVREIVRETKPGTPALLPEQPASGALNVTVVASAVTMNQNFANHAASNTPGGIGGFIFDDLNANGKLDSNELGLANRFVYLDTNSNGTWDLGEPATFTDPTGHYLFGGLSAGSYQVRTDVPPGAVQTTPASAAKVTLAAGQNVSISIGQSTGSGAITGTVFIDANDNGKFDSGETGLSGRTLYLDLNGDGAFESSEPSVVTDSTGAYTFAGLSAGTYEVRQVVQQESAGSQSWYETNSASFYSPSKTLKAGQKIIDNFGDRQTTGTLDNLTFNFSVMGTALQLDGKLVAVGYSGSPAAGTAVSVVARYNPDATPDLTFGTRGEVIKKIGFHQSQANDVAVQLNGQIVVVGDSDMNYGYNRTAEVPIINGSEGYIYRYNGDGSVDSSLSQIITQPGYDSRRPTLDRYGYVLHLQRVFIMPSGPFNGDIMVFGSSAPYDLMKVQGITNNSEIYRFHPGGSLDMAFGRGGETRILPTLNNSEALIPNASVRPDGSFALPGQTAMPGRSSDFIFYPVDSAGAANMPSEIDFSGRNDFATASALQADGKTVVVGYGYAGDNPQGGDFEICRLTASGSLDTSFGTGGKVMVDFGANDIADDVLIEPDGGILVSGHSIKGNNTAPVAVLLKGNGTIDSDFGASGRYIGAIRQRRATMLSSWLITPPPLRPWPREIQLPRRAN